MNNLTEYKFKGAESIRGGKDYKGEPFLVAKDICDVLGIKKYRDILQRLRDNCKGSFVVVETPGGSQPMSTVNEAGLYALIFKSRKKKAEEFQGWVTSVVLPSIRETGGYITEKKANNPDVALKFAKSFIKERNAHMETRKQLIKATKDNNRLSEELSLKEKTLYQKEKKIEQLNLSNEYLAENSLPPEDLVSSAELAAMIGIGSAIAMHKWLRKVEVLTWDNGCNILTPTWDKDNHFTREVCYSSKYRDGTVETDRRIMWTEKGVIFVTNIYNSLKKEGYIV